MPSKLVVRHRVSISKNFIDNSVSFQRPAVPGCLFFVMLVAMDVIAQVQYFIRELLLSRSLIPVDGEQFRHLFQEFFKISIDACYTSLDSLAGTKELLSSKNLQTS